MKRKKRCFKGERCSRSHLFIKKGNYERKLKILSFCPKDFLLYQHKKYISLINK
jgi:hypothetical protein